MDQLVDFADNNKLLALGLLASWAAVMFYELRLKATTISQVSPADAVRVINKGAMIIDVRSVNAYESGRIVSSFTAMKIMSLPTYIFKEKTC